MRNTLNIPVHLFHCQKNIKMPINKMKLLCLIALGFTLLNTQTVFAKEWFFDVYLDKSLIGQHRFELIEAENGKQTLISKANFNVKVLFINAYEYEHKATEIWQNNCITSLTAHTVENDEVTDVKARIENAALIVESQSEIQSLPACVMTFAYWNPAMLNQTQLLNPQNAQYLKTDIKQLDDEEMMVKTQTIKTQHYKLLGSFKGKNKLNIELWYDKNHDWVALKSITPEGYTISYKLK